MKKLQQPQCTALPLLEWEVGEGLHGSHYGKRVKHAVKRGAADAENLSRSQLVTVATAQYRKYVSTNDVVEPPRA